VIFTGLIKKPPAFHATGRFITVFTKACLKFLFWARWTQSLYFHIASLGSILILLSYLRLGLPSGLFPSGFLTKKLYAFLTCPMRVTSLAEFILPDFITLIIFDETCKLWSSSLFSLLQPPATSSLSRLKLSLCFNWAPRHDGVLREWRYSSTHSLIWH